MKKTYKINICIYKTRFIKGAENNEGDKSKEVKEKITKRKKTR